MRALIRLVLLIRLILLPLAAPGSLLALQGCSTTAPAVSSATREAATYHEHIAISGRFSVSYPHEGKTQSAQGRFHWQQRGDEVSIDLLSPLGQTLARIRVTPFIAMLERPGQQTQSATSASELTEQMLGWPMPADGLRFWLQGFSASDTGAHPVAPNAEGAGFHAGGWQVRYVSWQPWNGGNHPRRIDLSRSSQTAGELALRLVIDGWEPR